jgi:glutamate synthase domain-containing protein 3
MPLNAEHQMNILKDILSNHQSDCCGTVAECEQVERLIQSMLAKGYASTDVQATLQNVYKYTQDAKSAAHLDEHSNQSTKFITMGPRTIYLVIIFATVLECR